MNNDLEKRTHAKSNNSLKALTPVLKRWIELVERYCAHDPEDACYWYNERASLSVLAAAAWSNSNWIALEEFSTKKTGNFRDRETGKIKDNAGRCDLYIASRNGKAQFAIEAKQAWQPLGNRVDNNLGNVREELEDAKKDARALSASEATRRLALTICVPSINSRTLSQHIKKGESLDFLLKKWIDQIEEKIKPDAIAYAFPKKASALKSLHNERTFPGVVLLFQEVKKGKRISKKES